ncbi:MAG: arsenate reductase ArsC [Fibrobacterota bacterium]|nr:arsenate reductase ArsC [Fibrobacterota bacterium]QQS03429.1 MAG: arsenate reductase ArsC [Fibrobacterota bacterium]
MKTKLLFLCTGNSCRSQMAEAWARHLKGDLYDVYSAGIETHGLNPNMVKVMAEAGIDVTSQTSDNISKYLDTGLDVVVSVCAHADENCPVFPGKVRRVHHGFDDPPKLARELAAKGASEDQQLEPYRRVRDQIKAWVETLPGAIS